MTQSQIRTYQTDAGTRLHYRISGNGRPVLLLHGFGEDGRIWDLMEKELRNHFRVYVPDIPGSGLSELLPLQPGIPPSIEDYAHAVKAMVDREKLPPLPVIGHSMGGYIALAFAETYPRSISQLGLFHSTALADNAERKAIRIKALELIERKGALWFLREVTPINYSAGWRENNAVQMQTVLDRLSGFSDAAILQYYRAIMNRPDRTGILKNFGGPVLFIAGVHDQAVSLGQTLSECRHPRISQITILEKSAHTGMLEEPERAAAALMNFLQLAED
jgi:pimeloyl-ACP methyl ester carboxylesterase